VRPCSGRASGPWPGGYLSGYFAWFGGARYHASVFGIAGRRIAESVVALFALLGFAYVPLGKKTALEHSLDIFTTPAAKNAWDELTLATARLKDKLIMTVMPNRTAERAIEPSGAKPEVPMLPPKRHAH
jgi:hypothetical protein